MLHSEDIDRRRPPPQTTLQTAAPRQASVGIPRRDPSRPAPLSFAQERMWFLDQLAPGSPFYVESSAVRLTGSIDAAALERAINAVVTRHDVLRTSIELRDDVPVQIVSPSLHVPLSLLDLSGVPESERKQEIERAVAEQGLQPFDLSRGPLLRTRLISSSPREHVFVLTIHHIVSDGWSMRVFSNEVNEHYAAFTTGRAARVPILPIQYGDFAQWQRESLRGEVFERQLRYWRERLAGAPELDLPLDHPRPRMLGYRGAHLDIRLPLHLSAALRAASRREQATLFMSSLAAFAALLGFYTGQEEVVFGVPVAGRNRPEVEPLIGLFLNTIVLRIDLSGDPSYRQLLGRVKRAAMEAYENQDVPFDRLVEELQPDRDLGRNPLFQVLFQFFTPPNEKAGAPGAEADAISFQRGTAALDLSFHLWDTPGGIAGRLEYSTELFEAATIDRLHRHFVQLLTAVLADATRPLSCLSPLTPSERELVVQGWQGQQLAYPHATVLHEVFRQQAAATPEAVAIVADEGRMRFAELEGAANRLAQHLRMVGVEPGQRVAICLERSSEMITAMLAVLKTGAAFVPLDPSYPIERLRYIIADCEAKALIAHHAQRERLHADSPALLVIDPGDTAITRCSPEPPPLVGHPLDVAYVIYTSGSTGRPKGVMGLHRATLNRFAWMWKNFPFSEGEVACQKTAVSFVDAIWEIFGPLLAGVSSVIIPDSTARDPRALIDSLAAHNVTRLLVVPSLLGILLETRIDLAARLPRLRWWFTSGERLPAELAWQFREAVPQATLVNLYGSSEAAGDITCEVVSHEAAAGEIPIGRPIANSRAYVLDRHLRPLPPGLAGDLFVAGPNLARGYVNRPDLTAERFLPDPFASTPGERMYATGDRVRHLPDGRLEFLGRLDQQIKLRGHRIELGEIETVLKECPGVREAVTAVHEDGAGGRLAAYVVPETPAVEIEELRRFVTARLPSYMVPSAIVTIAAFPLLPNGKLDRGALRELKADGSASAAPVYAPPRTDTERAMASIWADLLQLQQIGADDNFFHLGGHSLLATRVVSRVRQEIGIEVPLAEIFLHPTLAGFAEVVESLLLSEIESLSEDQAQLTVDQTVGSRRE